MINVFKKKAGNPVKNEPLVEEAKVLSLNDEELYKLGAVILPRLVFTNAQTKEQIAHSVKKAGIRLELLEEVLCKYFYRLGATSQINGQTVLHNAFRVSGEAFKLMLQFETKQAQNEARKVFLDIFGAFLTHQRVKAVNSEQMASALIDAKYKVDSFDQVMELAKHLTICGLVMRSIVRTQDGYILEISEYGLEYLRDNLDKGTRLNYLPEEYKLTPAEQAKAAKELDEVKDKVSTHMQTKSLTF